MLVETYVSTLIRADHDWTWGSKTYGQPTNIRFNSNSVQILNNEDTYISIFSYTQRKQLDWLKNNKDVVILFESVPGYNVNHPTRRDPSTGNVLVVWEYIGKESESAKRLRVLVAPQMEKILAETTLSSSKTGDSTASPAVTTAMQGSLA